MQDIDKAITSIYNESRLARSRALPGENIELETQIGVTPKHSGTYELFWMSAYKYALENAHQKTWSQYRNMIVNVNNVQFRRQEKITSDGRVVKNTWQVKKKLLQIPVYDNWLTVQLSSESPSKAPMLAEQHSFRYISRHSFIIGVTRVDFSRVLNTSTNVLSHEIEAEYIFNKKADNKEMLSGYITTIKAILISAFNTTLPFTYTMLTSMSRSVNAQLSAAYINISIIATQYVNREYFSEALPLDIKMLTQEAMFQPIGGSKNNKNWVISLKTDGERRILIVSSHGTWLIYPPKQASLCAYDAIEHTGIGMTIIDGELADGKFYIIDSLLIDGKDTRNLSYVERLDNAHDWSDNVKLNYPALLDGLEIEKKLVSNIDNTDDLNFFTETEKMWMSRINVKYTTDGLIFTPNWETYYSSTNIDRRVILKWKPFITIDLRVRKAHDDTIKVYAWDDQKSEVEFTGTTSSHFKGEVIMKDIPYVRDSIIEFKCGNGQLTAYKTRPEKAGPNRLRFANDNWEKAMIPDQAISESTLLGKNSILMRKYHNRIKAKLFKEGSGILLDIGSGRGGDLRKWYDSGYTKIIAVEPIDDNIAEFKSRLLKYSKEFQKKVHILQARGQDTKDIKNFVSKHVNGGTVDTISMMDSLTFFFKTDQDLLDLSETIKETLVDGGLFLWKALDGKSLENKFKNNKIDKLEIFEDYIKLDTDKRVVSVKIGENVNDTEYLVDIDKMKTVFGMSGQTFVADEEALLREGYATLSSLYKYGIFIKGERLVPPNSLLMLAGNPHVLKESLAKHDLIESESAISAFENLFPTQSHSVLLSDYWNRSRIVDNEYTSATKEPSYVLFETAHSGYFLKRFFQEKASKTDGITEMHILFTAPTDDESSLAFASILKIDMFIVDSKHNNLLSTNAVEGINNISVIIVKKKEKQQVTYKVKLINNYPLSLSSASNIKKYKRNPLPRFHKIYEESIPKSVSKNFLINTKTKTLTPILDRVAYVSNLEDGLRLRSLSNYLINKGKEKSTEDDFIQIKIAPTQELITWINKDMKLLLK